MHQTTKTTCESKGHLWQSTSSPLIFRCGRTGCKAMQHHINGVWRETYPDQRKPAPMSGAQQIDMWA